MGCSGSKAPSTKEALPPDDDDDDDGEAGLPSKNLDAPPTLKDEMIKPTEFPTGNSSRDADASAEGNGGPAVESNQLKEDVPSSRDSSLATNGSEKSAPHAAAAAAAAAAAPPKTPQKKPSAAWDPKVAAARHDELLSKVVGTGRW